MPGFPKLVGCFHVYEYLSESVVFHVKNYQPTRTLLLVGILFVATILKKRGGKLIPP